MMSILEIIQVEKGCVTIIVDIISHEKQLTVEITRQESLNHFGTVKHTNLTLFKTKPDATTKDKFRLLTTLPETLQNLTSLLATERNFVSLLRGYFVDDIVCISIKSNLCSGNYNILIAGMKPSEVYDVRPYAYDSKLWNVDNEKFFQYSAAKAQQIEDSSNFRSDDIEVGHLIIGFDAINKTIIGNTNALFFYKSVNYVETCVPETRTSSNLYKAIMCLEALNDASTNIEQAFL